MFFHMNTKKNIFLTGAPSSGKTTVIKKVIENLDHPTNGFYTEEERVNGKRVGFLMKTLDGGRGYLAHQEIKSDFHIRRYGVSIENIENIAVPSITPIKSNIIILDEIGKMELFSKKFQEFIKKQFQLDISIVATIGQKIQHPVKNFILKISKVNLFNLTRQNQQRVFQEIISLDN